MKNENKEIKEILGKILGTENVPDDCVVSAMLNDNRLMKLAEYDLTKGYTDINIQNEQIQARFAEFKNIVLKKSSTLAELEITVFSRYGILERPRIDSAVKEKVLSDIGDVQFADKRPVITGFTPERNTKNEKSTTKGTKEKRG